MSKAINDALIRYQNEILLLGRVLFAEIFVLSGFVKIFAFQKTVDYMINAGVPYPAILLIPATILELGGGLMVLLGFFTRLGAFFLFLLTLSITFAIHHFWSYPPAEAMNQMINFQKNTTMLGGCLYIIVFGGGAYSLDYWLAKRKTPKVS